VTFSRFGPSLNDRLWPNPVWQVPEIDRARASLVASFANGIAKDIAAVRATIVSQWSNGQTEGQITSSNWSNAKRMGEVSSICFKPGCRPELAAGLERGDPVLRVPR
jgi:hypothetical protein